VSSLVLCLTISFYLYKGFRWRPRPDQWLIQARRPRLVLGWVTAKEDRRCEPESVRRCGLKYVTSRPYSRYHTDTDVKWIKPNQFYLDGANHRQGFAVLMVLVNVVLKWLTSVTHQSHNCEYFDFIFCKSNYAPQINNPPSLVGIVSAGVPPRGGEIYESRVFYNFLFAMASFRVCKKT